MILTCADKFIDPKVAAEIAVDETKDNQAKIHAVCLSGVYQAGNHSRDVRAAGVMLTGRKWAQNRTLRCSFMAGDGRVIDKIKPIAEEWLNYINLKFQWVDSGGEIRINIDDSGSSWSYLGTSNLNIPANEATMNYGWLEPSTALREYQRVVRHEFGHMLGFPHEHSHPQHDIPWDKPKVYDHYMRTQGWTKEDVDQQVFARYSESQTQFSKFDKTSIMLYPVPQELTIGDYSVGWNHEISKGDQEFAAWQYPKATEPVKPPPAPVSREKVRVSTLYKNPSKYYGKKLEIQTGIMATPRWNADPIGD